MKEESASLKWPRPDCIAELPERNQGMRMLWNVTGDIPGGIGGVCLNERQGSISHLLLRSCHISDQCQDLELSGPWEETARCFQVTEWLLWLMSRNAELKDDNFQEGSSAGHCPDGLWNDLY